MDDLYLPFGVKYDPCSKTFCCTGIDRAGKPFGVGSGPTQEIAEQRLREYVLESLLADAADGNDHTGAFSLAPKGGGNLVFTRIDLAPIRAWLP